MKITVQKDFRIVVDSVKPMSMLEFTNEFIGLLDSLGIELYEKEEDEWGVESNAEILGLKNDKIPTTTKDSS